MRGKGFFFSHLWFVHDLSKSPDVLVVAVVLLTVDNWCFGPDASFVVGGVATDENCVVCASCVRVDPVVTCREKVNVVMMDIVEARSNTKLSKVLVSSMVGSNPPSAIIVLILVQI